MTTVAPGPDARAPVRFNPFSPSFREDPYPAYRALRETRPVHRTMGMWVLTRHADVRAVLADRTFGVGVIPALISKQAARVAGPDVARIARLSRASLVFTDDPDHARLRPVLNRVFTARAIAARRPHAAAAADRLLAAASAAGAARAAGAAGAAGEIDAVADFAAPLAVGVLCDWMGLPAEVRARVAGWTHDIRFLLEPGLMSAADFTRVREVVELFVAALEPVVAERRARPGDDLISALLAAQAGTGDSARRGDEELLFVCIMCFVAGVETTTALIVNGLLALLRHPEQAALARSAPGPGPGPGLAAGVVEETLRYDSPLQMTKRLAGVDTVVGGETIRAGEQVLLCLGAANRDPAAFERPDTFDVTRPGRAHLAFGHGMHVCLGGLLARLEAEVAFEAVLRHPIRLARPGDPVEWQDHSFIVRRPRRLPVALGARPDSAGRTA